MEHREGKRLAKSAGMSGGAKAAIAAAVIAAALLAGGYGALCLYVDRAATFLPNSAIAGVAVGGMTQGEAAEALQTGLPARLAELSVPFLCGATEYAVSGQELSFDAGEAARAAMAEQQGHPFTGGVRYLAALTAGADYPVSLTMEKTPQPVAEAVEASTDPEAQTTWEIVDGTLLLHKGRTGRTVDIGALTGALTERFNALLAGSQDNGYIEAQVATAPPVEPDFQEIYTQVHVEAADAYLDPDPKEIVPAVTGIGFDMSAAAAALEQTQEGGDCAVPLEYTTPALTTEAFTAKLFADVLGTSTTHCAADNGTNRWYNIDLAASRCNGIILLPGEVFSYNEHAGPYTKSSGYRDAGTYQNGQSIDATAGGICQLSSTLYWTTLKANLEIVERNKHAFNGGYMPVVGTDATVYSDQLDFRFKNNTDYPIKIECYQDKSHYLHVTLYGTDTTGIHGEPHSVVISTNPAKRIYVADATVPAGSAPVRDPNYPYYNGITVDVYQKLVDKNGTVISDTFLYRNTYKVSNPRYRYNPADAARLGIDPSTGLMSLTPVTPTPEPTPEPTPTVDPTPAVTEDPGAVTPEPTPTTPVFVQPGDPSTPEPPPAPTPVPDPEPTPVPTPDPFTGIGPGMEPEDPAGVQSVAEE